LQDVGWGELAGPAEENAALRWVSPATLRAAPIGLACIRRGMKKRWLRATRQAVKERD